MLVHQPAQLDEEPVRVGVLLLRAVELFQALGGLLAAQAHAMQELIDPSLAGTDVESLCVEPFAHQASDRHRAEAQDIGHSQDVLAQPRRVCGCQHASPAARVSARAAKRECSGRSRRTSRGTDAGPRTSTGACPIAALSSTGPACRGTSRERWGRRGPCGASNHCRWARLQRVRRLRVLARLWRHGES